MDSRLFTVGSLIPSNIVSESLKILYSSSSIHKSSPTDNIQSMMLIQNGKRYEIQQVKGQLLLDAALKQGQELQYKCRKGTCGLCKVKIDHGSAFLLPPNDIEQKKLKNALDDGYRLACQSVIR
ncbi:(2Fe-2S)-binding protein [Bacillus sp. FJAT-49705]|uniref:(2Fe-2S)-binding protein n=1 Tax=Cytobacillus citreus TaxID=2833586 RepID=A0ABS5NUM2_9BACI|nr:(2Fe-2S)-binding protein [Cytobacillus citreus]